jgi:hypothetical protein
MSASLTIVKVECLHSCKLIEYENCFLATIYLNEQTDKLISTS